jgi:hypothetical protein
MYRAGTPLGSRAFWPKWPENAFVYRRNYSGEVERVEPNHTLSPKARSV